LKFSRCKLEVEIEVMAEMLDPSNNQRPNQSYRIGQHQPLFVTSLDSRKSEDGADVVFLAARWSLSNG
jgi:hypothetical protein